ncbi:YCF48-related protein [Cyclobacterium qasimii]|uniref:CHU large protein n=2 Tax=Cyclobacterium qasimii TaxID=1350429 RepID=S7VQZ3_9BACT|nr:YCF48-related protein [Cyclobacterium qasimii]EPR71767.1 CHU large protein [Cyclobacterium qasimii M12-11B]GEO22181.1 hypothetical protein CQA01_27150 [Cyclobacterium qasimii]
MVNNTAQGGGILYAFRIISLIVGLFLSFPSLCQWQRVSIGTDKTLTHISPVNGDTIYIAGFDGLFKTYDFGKTWHSKTIDELPGSYFYKTHFFNSKVGLGVGPIVMANSEAIAKTYDGGDNWNLVHAFNGGSWPREFNDVEFLDSKNGIAFGTNGRVLYTEDAGETWNVLISDRSTNYIGGSFYSAKEGYLLSGPHLQEINNLGQLNGVLTNNNLDFVAVEALSKNEIIISSRTKIYRTYDGASTWFIYDLPFSKVTTMFVKSSEIIYLGTENGVYVTYDGGSKWEWFKETKTQHVENIYLRNDGKGFIVGKDGMIFQTSNSGGPSVPLINFSYSVKGRCGYSYVQFENGSHESYNYKWFIDDQLVSTEFEDAIRITETFRGEISLIASNGVASDTLTKFIEVYVETVSADAGEDVFACYGEAVTLNPKIGHYNYSWHPTTGLSNPKIANPISTHPTTIEYVLTVTSGFGCSESDTVTIYREEPIPEVVWERMNVNTKWKIIDMQMVNDTLGFARTINRVLKSTDGGKNWHEMGSPSSHEDVGKIHFFSADTGFVASEYLYKTTDGGKSYSRTIGGIRDIEFLNSKIGYAVSYSINDKSSIYKTLDGGNSWEKQYERKGVIRRIECIDENNCTAVGEGDHYNSEMFLRTTDGKTWEKPTFISTGNDYFGIYDIDFIDDKLGFAKGGISKVWKTVDGGASWAIDYHLPTSNMIEFFDRNRGLSGTGFGQIYQTINGGKCWQYIGDTPPMSTRGIYIYKNNAFAFGSPPFNSNGDGYSYAEIYRAKFLKTQEIRFNSIAEMEFGDQNFHIQALASSNLPVQFTSSNNSVAIVNGNSISIKGAGTAVITASQAGDEEYMSAKSVSQNLVVKKADQTITFEIIVDKMYGDNPFDLISSASSGLNVTYSVVSGHATLSGNTLSLTESGNVTVKAIQEGNINFESAEATQSFCVLPPTPDITASGITLSSSSPESNQWFLNGELIQGATNSTFEAVSSGDYTVKVQGSCGSSFYSTIYQYTITSFELDLLKEVMLYPNPATDHITLDLPEGFDLISTRVINSLGVPIKHFTLEENGVYIKVGELVKGVYFLELKTSNVMHVKKFIVQ